MTELVCVCAYCVLCVGPFQKNSRCVSLSNLDPSKNPIVLQCSVATLRYIVATESATVQDLPSLSIYYYCRLSDTDRLEQERRNLDRGKKQQATSQGLESSRVESNRSEAKRNETNRSVRLVRHPSLPCNPIEHDTTQLARYATRDSRECLPPACW